MIPRDLSISVHCLPNTWVTDVHHTPSDFLCRCHRCKLRSCCFHGKESSLEPLIAILIILRNESLQCDQAMRAPSIEMDYYHFLWSGLLGSFLTVIEVGSKSSLPSRVKLTVLPLNVRQHKTPHMLLVFVDFPDSRVMCKETPVFIIYSVWGALLTQ